MHFAITLVVVALLYLGLFHTRVNKWAALIVPLVVAAVAHAVAPGAQSGIGLVIEYLALFLVGSIGLATRTIDSVADDLDRLEADPAAIRADGAALADHLRRLGFEPTPERWMHFPRLGWDSLAMKRGAVNLFMVSGEKGPAIEFTTRFDDGRTAMTVATARDQVAPHFLRQCFPDEGVDRLLAEHERAVSWLTSRGHRPHEIALNELSDHLLGEERNAATTVRRRIGGSMLREVRKTNLDVGSIVGRSDVVERLDPGR